MFPSAHRLLFALTLLTAAPVAPLAAHSVWLEPLPDGQLALRFGEWGEEPETSPGHLDGLIAPSAITLKDGEPQPFVLGKKAEHYLLGESSAAEMVVARSDYGVMQRGDAPARRPIFHARWWPASRPPADFPITPLDLMPSAAKPGWIQVNFKGQPVAAGVELTFYPPGAVSVKLVTDASGHVQLPEVTGSGLCLLALVRYSDPTPGEFQGKPYAVVSHSATLCWRVKAATP